MKYIIQKPIDYSDLNKGFEYEKNENGEVIVFDSIEDAAKHQASKKNFTIEDCAKTHLVESIGTCSRCGNPLFPSDIAGYASQCFVCDEDFFGFEQPPFTGDNKLCVRVKNGYLVATACTDPDYPGIDVEFVADGDNGEYPSRPRVLVEQPAEDNPNGDVRALVWGDKTSEDYTDEINFE